MHRHVQMQSKRDRFLTAPSVVPLELIPAETEGTCACVREIMQAIAMPGWRAGKHAVVAVWVRRERHSAELSVTACDYRLDGIGRAIHNDLAAGRWEQRGRRTRVRRQMSVAWPDVRAAHPRSRSRDRAWSTVSDVPSVVPAEMERVRLCAS